MKFLLMISFYFFSFAGHATWDLNDVSYLMPLPQTLGSDGLLKLQSPGRGGNLLNPEIVRKMPRLAMGISEEAILSQLRVVGVRLDPCFPLPTPLDCQPQVRMVWQILIVNRQGQTSTIDAALHSFYNLKNEEFRQLLSDISMWRKKYPSSTQGLPLQVHPAWSQLKDRSPALQEFQVLLTRYAGMENLTRVTNMLLRGNGDMWAFQIYEPRSGNFELQPIARLQGQLVQTFINTAVPSDHFAGGGMSPHPAEPDTIDLLTSASEALLEGQEEIVTAEFKALMRIENPKIFTAENMDCVSCHAAQPARIWALNQRGDLGLTALMESLKYKNLNSNLTNLSPEAADTRNLRAFGYFGREIALSQRLIHESAEVATLIREMMQNATPLQHGKRNAF